MEIIDQYYPDNLAFLKQSKVLIIGWKGYLELFM